MEERVIKCVICHSSNIEDKVVDERVWAGTDVVLTPCQALVCNNCGERYYSRQTMQHLEEVEARIRARTLALETVGRVLRIATQPAPALAVRESRPDYTTKSPEPSDNGDQAAQE
jgi:YgiT-type zinc finger domain-containing protein